MSVTVTYGKRTHAIMEKENIENYDFKFSVKKNFFGKKVIKIEAKASKPKNISPSSIEALASLPNEFSYLTNLKAHVKIDNESLQILMTKNYWKKIFSSAEEKRNFSLLVRAAYFSTEANTWRPEDDWLIEIAQENIENDKLVNEELTRELIRKRLLFKEEIKSSRTMDQLNESIENEIKRLKNKKRPPKS